MSKKNKVIFFAICFTLIQSLILLGLFKHRDEKYVGTTIFVTIIYLLFTFFELKYKVYMSTYIRVIMIITIVSHFLFGNYLGLYESSKYFDKALHFFGTYSVTFFVYSLLNKVTKKQTVSKPREFLFIFCLGVSLGTIFEIIEFFVDISVSPTPPSQAGLTDTNLDMIFNLFGALACSFHLLFSKDM